MTSRNQTNIKRDLHFTLSKRFLEEFFIFSNKSLQMFLISKFGYKQLTLSSYSLLYIFSTFKLRFNKKHNNFYNEEWFSWFYLLCVCGAKYVEDINQCITFFCNKAGILNPNKCEKSINVEMYICKHLLIST